MSNVRHIARSGGVTALWPTSGHLTARSRRHKDNTFHMARSGAARPARRQWVGRPLWHEPDALHTTVRAVGALARYGRRCLRHEDDALRMAICAVLTRALLWHEDHALFEARLMARVWQPRPCWHENDSQHQARLVGRAARGLAGRAARAGRAHRARRERRPVRCGRLDRRLIRRRRRRHSARSKRRRASR